MENFVSARVFFLVNLRAGGGRGEAVWRGVQQTADRQGLAYEFEVTRAPLTGISFVRQALRAGARTVVAVGGDGTVFDAINGLFLDDAPIAEDAAIAVIPAGRTNDFARNLGIPGGPAALSLLDEGKQISVDLGVATFVDTRGVSLSRWFGNGVRIGGSPVPMPAAPDFGPMGWTGKMIVDDGDEFVVYARTLIVAQGPYVGGARVAPRAKMDDGLLDVVIQEPPSGLPADLAPSAGRGDDPDARGHHVVFTMDGAPFIEIDGATSGRGSIDVQIRPAALSVYVGRP